MRKPKIIGTLFGALVCALTLAGTSSVAQSDSATTPLPNTSGYGNVPPDQIEFLSSEERMLGVISTGSPSAIWEALEHGERVECLKCIPAVAPLLYDRDPHTREIAAWWLRRRMLGVFGPGEVYEQTVNALKSDPDPVRRAQAASALGEFLVAPGIDATAQALAADPDPRVRTAAASALGRLNDDGKGALGRAMGDSDAHVKLAALESATHINTFTDVAAVAGLVGDGDAAVRRRAVEALDALRAKDSVASVMQLAKSDPDADVRAAACHALGTFRDGSARSTLEDVAAHDANGLVRDMAQIALRQI